MSFEKTHMPRLCDLNGKCAGLLWSGSCFKHEPLSHGQTPNEGIIQAFDRGSAFGYWAVYKKFRHGSYE